MTLVIDAAFVVAGLIDEGPTGQWAEERIFPNNLAAPHLMPVEAANILRRTVMTGDVSSDSASMAYEDLQALRVELFPYRPFAARVWELRSNLTAYDAWYVSVAEALGVPLATLDIRLSRAPGCRCSFELPPTPV